jgi:hypothetical protein
MNHRRSADPRDLHHCKLRAVRTADNDIRMEGDRRSKPRPAELPLPIQRKILDHVTEAAKNHFTVKEWTENPLTCDEIFSPVFRLEAPSGLQLYVGPRDFALGNAVDYFIMYDPLSKAVTKSPPFMFTKWWQAFDASDPLEKHPVVRMEPARSGWPPLLIVEEGTHNGTVYNAVVYRYFEIGKDMSLTQVLAVEARAFFFGVGPTEREARFLTPNRVQLTVTTPSSRKYGARGTVLLERTRSGQPFHVTRRTPLRGIHAKGLITYCVSAKSDDDFLRLGCDFYY